VHHRVRPCPGVHKKNHAKMFSVHDEMSLVAVLEVYNMTLMQSPGGRDSAQRGSDAG